MVAECLELVDEVAGFAVVVDVLVVEVGAEVVVAGEVAIHTVTYWTTRSREGGGRPTRIIESPGRLLD